MKNMNGKDIDPKVMKQYSQGEGFDDQSTDTAPKTEASVGVKSLQQLYLQMLMIARIKHIQKQERMVLMLKYFQWQTKETIN